MRSSSLNARLRWALLAVLAAAGCTPNTNFDSALLVKVTVPATSASKCVRIVVKPDSGAEASTGLLTAKSELTVAVYQAKDWSSGVTLVAHGFASCDAATNLTAPAEQSAEVKAVFPASGTETVQLSLIVKPADLDNDGHPAGADDCNDNDATVYRGAPEQCSDTVDRNCSGQTGCDDLTCTGACGQNGTGQCVAGICRATTEVSCIDGEDNDADQLTDCADSDCANIACDDGTACTSGERCNSQGQCAGGAQTSCNTPPGACFNAAGTCNALDGGCSYAVRTGSCDDQSACTSGDSCVADGGCEGAPSVVCNAPPTQCHDVAGMCNPQDAGCSYAVRTGSCDDSNACTSGESCQTNGSCGAPTGTTSCQTPPGQCFVSAGTCDTADGGCSYAVRTGTCDDGNGCTTGEQCLSDGGCGSGSPTVCNTPPDQCSQAVGVCSTATGMCTYAPRTGPCNDNNACTGGETCNVAGVCTGGIGVVTCSTPPGQCYDPAGMCIPADAGCTYNVRSGGCDDQNACTTGESCQTDGTCGAPTGSVSCSSPPNSCFTPNGTCNPADGGCGYSLKNGNNNPCDDQNACTSGDRCLLDGGCGNPASTVTCTTPPSQCFATTGVCNKTDATCSYSPRTGSCDDGNPCTVGEQCLTDGGCGTGTAVVCNVAPDQCHTNAGTCQVSDGGCSYPVKVGSCDDNSACTSGETCQPDGTCGAPVTTVTCGAPPTACFNATGTCNPADAGCAYTPRGGTNPCDDNDQCTTGERCLSDGGCGSPTGTVSCTTPPGQCFAATGTCNPANATCSYLPRTGSCDDGNPCTTGDVCAADGGCAGGAPVVCDTSPGQCFSNAGTCQTSDGGCSYPVLTGNVCNDLNGCTLGETCQSDGSCGASTPKACPAPAQCFDAGVCLPADGGCSYTPAPSGDSCNDGNLCTSADTCNGAGACSPGSAVICTVANPCFDAGTCAPATGCPAPAPMSGAACSDTDPCTFGESCNGSGICTPATTTTCTPNECQNGGSCLTDAGCSFNNRQNGFNCNSGNGDCFNGVCITPVAFTTYTPSNFTPDTTKAVSELTIDCALTFNTDGTSPSFTPCRSNESVTPEVITQSGSSVQAVVLHVAKLTVTSAGSLTVTGARPLIIAVYGDATVAGTIDVSATLAASGPGAGLNCPTTTPTNGTQTIGNGASGAGAGGSASTGGNGGQGDGTSTVGTGGANNGNNPALTPLVGGCRGAVGGNLLTTGASGGGGGGAVQISASGVLRVSGSLAAAGGGGAAGVTMTGGLGSGGGGGGGAGGILLEGNTVTLLSTARLSANGGSGGEGGAGNGGVSATGSNGTKDTRNPATNSGTSNGGNGGAGGAGATLNGSPGNTVGSGNNGGGGGGGSAGRVRINSASSVCRETNHVVSPSGASNATLNPAFTINATTTSTPATCP